MWYLPSSPVLTYVADEEIEGFYSLVDSKGNLYGYIEVSDEGHFNNIGIDLLPEEVPEEWKSQWKTTLTYEELKGRAESFVHEFCQYEVTFSSSFDWGDGEFMFMFEALDEELDILLPNTGSIITFNQYGFLQAASVFPKPEGIRYPEIKVSEEEAYSILMKEPLIELGIDMEQATPKLQYIPVHEIMGVTVDGDISRVFDENPEVKPVFKELPASTTTTAIESLLGVPGHYKKYEAIGSRIWWQEPKEEVEEGDEPILMDVSEEGYVLIRSSTLAPTNYSNPLPKSQLYQAAVELLYAVEPEVNAYYKYVFDGEEAFEFDGMEWEEGDEEPTEIFTFQPFYKGIPVNSETAYVHVGYFTGFVRDATIPTVQKEHFQAFTTTPTLNFQQAQEIYTKDLLVKLSRTSEEDGFDLMYRMDVPKSARFIEKIDAHTAEVTYVESGIVEERD